MGFIAGNRLGRLRGDTAGISPWKGGQELALPGGIWVTSLMGGPRKGWRCRSELWSTDKVGFEVSEGFFNLRNCEIL